MANRFPLIFNSGAGQIQELAASDNLDLTSSNLVNAGILSTSSGIATAPSLQIGSGTTYNPGLYSPGTDQLAISTNGAGRLFVNASGHVGVGSAPSSWDSAKKVLQSSSASFVGQSDRFEIWDNGYYDGSNVKYVGAGTMGLVQALEGRITFSNAVSGLANASATLSERARIRADGMFEVKGAGTAGSSPAFSVNGSAPANSAVIDSSGRLLVGTSSYTGNGRLIAAGNTGGDAGTLDICWTGSRPTAANTDIGYIRWYSVDNSSGNAHYASINASSDGASSSGSDIPGRLVFSTTPDNGSSPTSSPPAMTIKSSQEVLIGTSTITANGGILQLKSGITFPATAVAASNVNTLDDYEQGEWTPAPTSTGATFTASCGGIYTKIGNVVYISGSIDNSSAPTGTLSNSMTITGLPFTSSSDIGYGCSITLGFLVAINYPDTAKELVAIVSANSTTIRLDFSVDDGSSINLIAQDFDFTDARIGFAGFYFV